MRNYIQWGATVAIAIGVLGLAVGQQSRAQPEESSARPMRIGVIGAGSLGGTVGRVLVKAGHEVKFSAPHPEELAPMAHELGPVLRSARPAKRRSLAQCCCLRFRM